MYYNCQFDKIVQLTKSSDKNMSLEVAFETVESRCLSKFIRSEFHAAGPAWEKASQFSELRPYPRTEVEHN